MYESKVCCQTSKLKASDIYFVTPFTHDVEKRQRAVRISIQEKLSAKKEPRRNSSSKIKTRFESNKPALFN